MELSLDRQVPIPLVEQLVQGIEGWLSSRKARPGTRLPSIRRLARPTMSVPAAWSRPMHG